eukprot:CAMPEP_0170174692 /NCGR_PEP_ID=MMETSP0040_2-20121228/7896_1 /TAXON_ID=641309 /ORGANISM="Lotharella oceanica, Strain CCMP622" /LENGTH=159 /DNA_ID=CAMNT_0010416429 /DNA_START=216 /DNA_END=695 /DNA_ORIENTATION=+
MEPNDGPLTGDPINAEGYAFTLTGGTGDMTLKRFAVLDTIQNRTVVVFKFLDSMTNLPTSSLGTVIEPYVDMAFTPQFIEGTPNFQDVAPMNIPIERDKKYGVLGSSNGLAASDPMTIVKDSSLGGNLEITVDASSGAKIIFERYPQRSINCLICLLPR